MCYFVIVLGAVFSHELIQQIMQNTTRQSRTKDCTDPSMACYLIDDGAFLIATNQDKYETSVSCPLFSL